MPKQPARARAKLLTDTELELMNLLWDLGEGSVRDIQARLPEDRQLAYTSVSTILRILVQKEVVGTRKQGRGHIYLPLIPKRDYEEKSVKHLVQNVFHGTPSALVRRLIDDVSNEELAEIKAMLDERLK